MKKTLLLSAALFATIAASAQTIVWPSTVNRETKEANLSATVTGSETITATDITLGADIKIGDKDGANAVTAVKNATGENLQFPSETEGMISWRPINGNVDGAEATADLAEGAGAYIDFTIEEGDINKTFAGMSSFEFDVTKVGTDAIRINVKLIGEGDTNVDTGWLINADNAKSFGDEYQADYDAEAKNKDYPWDEAANGYNPSRNDGSKGVSGGANANGISHVKLAVPAEFAASNPYKVTLRIAIIKCANNKDLGVNAVTFNFGDSTTPVEEEKVYSVIGTLNGNWDTDDDMIKGEDGIYTFVFENVAAGEYKFKVRQNHDWNINWGGGDDADGNTVFTVENDGSTVTITFNPATEELKYEVSGGAIEPAGEVLKVAGAEGAMEYAGTWAGNWWNLEENMNLDITAYDYLWIDYDGFEGAIQFGIFYSEWQKTESWGEVWYTDQVDLTAAAGIVGIPVEKTKIIEKGVGGVDSEFKGDVYAKHARQVFTQDKGKASKINIKGIYLGTKEQYEAALAGASAINAVKAAAQDSDAIYNIAGQKVSASYKGLVIKNGKKYIQK